ncbi:MAG TPA: Gfo/Idh/MocA family oxidoreductase [Pirellulaceae bacterium]
MTIGFGIVGCGTISRFHARAIADVRGAKLIACCSARPKSAEKFATELGCIAYPTLREMLADPRVNAVTVTTPSGAHLEPAVAAARAGKHVVVEKPLEVTLRKCDRIIRECERNHVQLAAIFQSRFHESARKLKRAIDGGRFGRLTIGDAHVKWFRSQEYYDSRPWRGTWALDGGGALMNQAIHSVDLLTWLMGPVVEVRALTATLAHKRIDVEDVAVASLRFANGALGVIEATTAIYPGYLKRIEIHGTEGSAVLEEEDLKVWDFASPRKEDKAICDGAATPKSGGGGASDPAAIGHHGHAKQLQDFVDAIRKQRAPAIDGHEGRRSIEIILAIYKSAESGKPIALPLKSDPVLKARSRPTKK